MRYLPLTDADRRAMLATVGVPSIDSLFRDVPASARLTAPVDLPDHLGEIEVERRIGALAARNLGTGRAPSFLGAGAYRHHVPAAVDHLIQRGEFLTSYTPYQPEVSQGTLQYLFEFQTQICLITGMEVANASMYDGATATAEAVMMANRVTRRRRALIIVAVTEPVSLGLVEPPGAMGADIVTAEGQPIGNALTYGGPYLGLFATREKYLRQMPGRLVCETADVDGKRGWVLTLSTREQHIRREKATSNICTNSGLCALAFTIHLTLLGEKGLRRLAEINHANACDLAERLAAVPGVDVITPAFFNEFTIKVKP